MSTVADRLGMAGLIACSKVMNITTDKGKKTGVFMEQGRDWIFSCISSVLETLGTKEKENGLHYEPCAITGRQQKKP